MKRALVFGVVLVAVSFCLTAHAFTVSYDQTTTGVRKGVTQETSVKIKDENSIVQDGDK